MLKIILSAIVLLSLSSHAQENQVIKAIKQQFIQAVSQKNAILLDSLFSKALHQELNASHVMALINQKEQLYGNAVKLEFLYGKQQDLFFAINYKGGKVPITISVEGNRISNFDIGYYLPQTAQCSLVKGSRGVSLHTKIGSPVGSTSVKGIVLMVHDRGPVDYNGNSAIDSTRREQDGIFYRFSREFRKKGFVTVRYNKSDAEVSYLETIGKEASLLKTQGREYRNLLDDIRYQVSFIKKKFSGVPIYLLGVGEGAGLSLQVANSDNTIKGVFLIGFSPLTSLLDAYRQFIFRPQHLFRSLDKNKDGVLTYSEMDRDLQKVDLNGDNQVTLSEYNSVSLVNFQQAALGDDAIRRVSIEQLSLPQVTNIIKKSWFKVVFIQGEWDSMSPKSFVKSVELMNQEWKKTNLKFIYVPKSGHNLNPKRAYLDDSFIPARIESFTEWVKSISSFL